MLAFAERNTTGRRRHASHSHARVVALSVAALTLVLSLPAMFSERRSLPPGAGVRLVTLPHYGEPGCS